MSIPEAVSNLEATMTEWRRHLHQRPELGFKEKETSAFVVDKLKEWGVEVNRLAGTGVVGTLRGRGPGRAIALRADMDALAMDEANDFAWHSRNAGAMHACGHDGHTTMLLGAACHLAQHRDFDGTVHFIFQPAEEGLGGARVMIDEGLFEKFDCDMVFGAHNDPLLKAGQMSVVEGPAMAASDRFEITIHGKGGHAARPHHSIDPVTTGAHIVVALQSIVSRRIDPLESAVLSTTTFHAGTAMNVIPEVATLTGTVRTLKPHVQDEMERLLREVATAAAATQGATIDIVYERGYPPVVNAGPPTERAAEAAIAMLGADNVLTKRPPSMGGEDFAFMALARPACFVRFGQAGPERGATPLHHPRYDFNDDILSLGAGFWVRLVQQELRAGRND